MAAVHNGTNGTNGANGASFPPARFSKVPESISVPVADEDGIVDIDLELGEQIEDDPTELLTLLETERSAKTTWVMVAIAYAKHKKLDVAIEVLGKAISVFAHARSDEKLSILNATCWLYLLKCREAPRVNNNDPDVKTKDHYLQQATGVINEASRISPSYPPLYLARGVLYLLRASMAKQGVSNAAGPNAVNTERMDTLKQAVKCFEDAIRASGGKNLMAKMGKARVSYSMGKYAEALKAYQSILESSPGLIDPDPRIGIGCCFWQLGFKDDAATAWQRSLDLNPRSKIALTLLGLHTLNKTSTLPATDPSFASLTKKSITDYIVPSVKLDNKYPLTCATLSKWYNITKDMAKVETLSRRAIELTDVNAIASDGWYQLARKEHQLGDTNKATDYYQRSDLARGGDNAGYTPAKFGSAQLRVLKHDYDGAKFRLEKILQQQSPAVEAQTLLGTLYAEDVFSGQTGKDDKSAALKKALKYLEDVQKAWKDPKRKLTPDPSVLLNLARLYETEHPEKSLKCLEEVEQIELDGIPEEDYPDIEDEADLKNALRELLPPQLLNNMACFHYQAERYLRARELFQAALQGCVKAADRDESIDTDALVTSISYNLGRTYEAEGMLNEAKDVFEGLQKRHPNYIDAQIRLAYIALRQQPTEEGPKAVKDLVKSHEDNLEVRALYGWYANKSKKRGVPFAEDQEQRHYKHTLQKFDKHDTYSLTGMGNIHLAIAREMRRDTEQDKEKRRKMYERAVEFFNKVLELDPRNAYAAQGIAIAMAEDRKEHSTSLQIFMKVKDTLKDFNVYMNLGHTYGELKQYARAIENYEIALHKKPHDLNIIACLGRVWFVRGKSDQSLSHMKTALEYSQQALKLAPNQNHLQFNVAFVQFQIAQLVYNLKETARTLVDVEEAQQGLDEAIRMFEAVANSENPPYPKDDIIQRANMGRNTMAKQLQRTHDKQAEYEKENADKLQQAREARENEIKKREDEKRRVAEEQAERARKIMEERQKLEERDREYMERRIEEDRRRQELIDDSEMRKSERRSKGKGGKRKKKGDADDSETEAGGSDSDASAKPRRRRNKSAGASGTDGLSDEERPRAKKRKLARKNEPVGKYKSAEFVDDDSDDELPDAPALADGDADAAPSGDDDVSAPRAGGRKRVVDEDEDEDDDVAAPNTNGDGAGAAAADDDEDE
ncbi:TPR-like protein [Karstenula rhodostoma CBS 690.94]|uniref:TPR-like protein n=1 Tax=Karstenula rhodostoma CBS 690.94 TaxID=1392251 RepID=A0A9P4PMU5_9PLEO|nr:TPR-like protein [Karstenula rhodostoma CBS 690.94]